ncbi:MAG: (Fe-S)-binding protein [Desulfobacteraceae bacterium]|nr:MAG: (Fe-S)-binding protein [Desulfobacteraceae bacterium]
MKQGLQNCGKCGLCLSACPVYGILKEEQVSPRAKLQLIKSHDNKSLESTQGLKEIVSRCLMCGSCAAACPAGIDHYSKFMEMRKQMVADHGESPAIKSMIYLLGREYRLKFGTGLAKTGQKMIPDALARSFKLGNIPIKNFPTLNPKPFRTQQEVIVPAAGDPVGSVIYFTGCATNYLYEDAGKATIGVLQHMGYQVIIPEKQCCCSVPMLFHGAQDQAMSNIRANIEALDPGDVEAIIVDCSTCGEALENEYPKLMEQGDDHAAATQIASKVTHIFSFVNDHMDLLTFDTAGDNPSTVTYHAPCHTRNNSQGHLAVESILKQLPNTDYRPSPDRDQCCGGGGTFFYEHPQVAGEMMAQKLTSVRNMEVDYWVTDCPVCRLNLAGNLEPQDTMQVVHPITFLYNALKA